MTMHVIDPTNQINEKPMAAAEVLTEDGVTPSNLALVFKRAFFKTAFDCDGDLIVETDGPSVIVIVDRDRKLLRFLSICPLNASAELEIKHAFANMMNDNVIVVRFAVSAQADRLVADYSLPYEEGVPAYLVVYALRIFARVVPAAIRKCDQYNLTGMNGSGNH